MKTALRLYQVMSWIVGIALLVLTYATIRDLVQHQSAMAKVVAPLHGWLYIIYLGTVVYVYLKFKPSLGRIFIMVISGFVPFLAFFTEHFTVKRLTTQMKDQEAAST
jgi:integral membrane protein